jgi:NAD(P)-dependent dehydrogenase (short-subunit alcohol dehydrogenase family)
VHSHGLVCTLLDSARAARSRAPCRRQRVPPRWRSRSTTSSQSASAGYYDYCATKAAVTNIAKSLSKELGPKNIRVNSVSPGPVSTPLWLDTGGLAHSKANGSGQTVDEVVASAVSGAATGRFTTPEEVADLVIFLASDRSANTTGADVRIDGGVVATL